MNVTLIHPRVPAASTFERLGRSHIPPLGVLYLASALEREGHRVTVLDLNLDPAGHDFARRVASQRPDLVGMSSLAPAYGGASALALELRRVLPDGTGLVVGGADATTDPGRYVRLGCFDAVLVGEAEQTLPALCAAWPAVPHMAGIIPAGTDPASVARAPLVDPDAAPLPARHLLPMRRYRGGPAFKRGRHTTSVFSHRGCPYTCTFCEKGVHDGPMRYRSAEGILEEVRRIRRDQEIHDIRFIDDVFMVNRKVLESFLELVLSSGERFSWMCTARVDHLEEALLRRMRRAGCYRLEVGVESGSERILQMVSKRITPADIRHGFSAARRAGLELIANYILGFPTETEAEIQQTIDFSLELDAEWAMFFDYYPLDGSPMAHEWGLHWDPNHTQFNRPDGVFQVSPERLDALINQAYLRYYFRPAAIGRKLWTVRSPWIWWDLAKMAGSFGKLMAG